MRSNRERGVTLIELIVSIVVIAIAASAVLGVLARSVGRSADAMVMSQAVSIAEAYLEEITLKPFVDPDGTDTESNRIDRVERHGGAQRLPHQALKHAQRKSTDRLHADRARRDARD